MQEYTDQELLYMIRQSDLQCYEILFDRYEKLIWKLIHKIHFNGVEMEEAYMLGRESFQVAVEGYQEKRGTQFGTYYYSVLTRSLLAYKRRLSIEETYLHSLDALKEEYSPGRFEKLMKQKVNKVRDLNATVHMMYKECGPKEQEIIELFLQGYTQKEIGSIMNISRYKVTHSLKKIRQKYEKLGENKPFD